MIQLLLLAAALHASALPKPGGLKVINDGQAPQLSWEAVEGAELYRVAVWGEPDADGKRPLMLAAWVRGTSYAYGSKKVVPKAGKLPSTKAKPLAAGGSYKAWVAAAGAAGENKSDWATADLTWSGAGDAGAKIAQKNDTAFDVGEVNDASPTPTPAMTATQTPTPATAAGEAELEVDLAADFKETPEAAEDATPSPTPMGTPSLERAEAALQAGKAEEAQAIYKLLVEADSTSADAWEGLGDAYDARKMKVEAKEAYEKALALDKKRDNIKKWMEENVRR